MTMIRMIRKLDNMLQTDMHFYFFGLILWICVCCLQNYHFTDTVLLVAPVAVADLYLLQA